MAKMEVWIIEQGESDIDDANMLFIETTTEEHPEVATYLELAADQCVHHMDKHTAGWKWPGWDQVGLGYALSYEGMVRLMDAFTDLPLDTYSNNRDPRQDLEWLRERARCSAWRWPNI
jgi:hypothetical protein